MRWSLLLLTVLYTLSVQADAVDYEGQSVTIALTQEPPSLDSTRMTDLVSFFVVGHINEGLVRYDRRGRLAPGVAESWEVNADHLLFRLRVDASWSDGSSVTAHDFVYAWRQVVDPERASPFAAIMYPIQNAEEIQRGEKPVDSLGVHAVDDRTLRVDLAFPCGYCLSLMPHGTFFPISREFHQRQGSEYGAEPKNLLANGPFRLSFWQHGARLTLIRNERYWDSDNIRLSRINVGYITEDNRTRLNLYIDNKIALVRLGGETVKDAVNSGLRLRTFPSGGLSYLRFNTRAGSPTADPRLRRAMQKVFDPETFVNKVIAIPGYQPAHTFFPRWLRGVEDRFTDEFPVRPIGVSREQGRALVADYVNEKGEVPSLTLLTVSSPTGAKIAEYFQGLFGQMLGLDIRVDQQTLKQYLDKSRGGQFDIAVSSWYPDFDDIMTYADLQASWNPNNRGGYVNPAYDRWLRVLQQASDPLERMTAADQLQKILQTDVPVLPMAETGSAYIQHPKLKGVSRRVLGQDPDYTYGYIVR